MASYLSRTGGQKKKKNILRQKELALRGDIRREASAEKLNRSAEKVRIAQLGVIRALRYEAEPVRGDEVDRVNDVILELDVALEYWDGISGEEIIPLYSEDLDVESTVERKRWWDFRPR